MDSFLWKTFTFPAGFELQVGEKWEAVGSQICRSILRKERPWAGMRSTGIVLPAGDLDTGRQSTHVPMAGIVKQQKDGASKDK